MTSPKAPVDIPILLTSSVVAHDPSVKLKDTDERIRLAMESVAQWLQINPSLKLVLCDGSNFDFSEQIRRAFPSAKVECLPFEGDQERIRISTRGYGEGEIVRHAINHSRFIAEAGCFAKCTSKLWVENYFQCAKEWNGRFLCQGVFTDAFTPLRKTSFSYIDTRFYIASVPIYRKYFEDAHHRIRMHNGKAFSLEDCFHEIVMEHQLGGILLRHAPVICGVGGGTGVYYKNSKLRRLKEDLRLWLARHKSPFRHLFTGAPSAT